MKIVVISLKGSERRRANMRKQLSDSGLAFEFFDAVSGHDALDHVHHYDDGEFIRNCGRSATANEIGCYASHLAVWEQCAQGTEPFLILEDDARLDPGFVHGFGIVDRTASTDCPCKHTGMRIGYWSSGTTGLHGGFVADSPCKKVQKFIAA